LPVEVAPQAVPGPAEPAPPAEETAPSEQEKGTDYRDLYLRARAEMANFRQRTEERAEGQIHEERRRLLREFLAFADNLERALAHMDERGLHEGVQLTWEGLRSFLEREGVEEIEAEGRPFDPQVHEAVAMVENGGEPGHAVQEVQRGYRYQGRLLRPARVVVSR
jgi:molecular chaperone GrpE